MIDGLTKRVELIANLAIIVVACLLGLTLIKTHFPGQQPQEVITNDKKLTGNASLSSLNIDWKKSDQTLVLILSNTCHFCTESAPFYKKIASNKGSARLVAIFPQSVEEGRAYLTRLDIDVDEVRQFRLESIGVEGTPTLLLINSSGVVTERWVGRLMPDQELVVLRALENLSS
jgi:thiol-disulfide isomerase/thioredoxin